MASNNSPSTSFSLVDGIRRRMPDDWNRYERVYGPLIARWCWRNGLREVNDVADIVQQVHTSVIRAIDTYNSDRPNSTFRGWLYRITVNHIVNLRRQNNRLGEPSQDADRAMIDTALSEEEDLRDLSGLVRRTAELLDNEFCETTRKAFYARYFDGRPYEEIAEELGQSEGAVRARIYRAAAKLKELLRDDFIHLSGNGQTKPQTEPEN